MLHQLWQRPADVLLQPVQSHRGLVGQDVHTLRELVGDCKDKRYSFDI